MAWGGRNRGSALVAFAFAFVLSLIAPASASAALAGSIEGVAVDPSLTKASVENLSVTYDGCEAEQSEELNCAWTAVAMLVPPWDSACPADGLYELPPGLPGHQPDATRVWYESASADGTVESGPLAFPLDRVDDEHLCLYINRSVESTSSVTSPTRAGPLYVPLSLTSELVASQLLHVNLPPKAPSTLPAEVEVGVSGKTVPARLPRSRPAPVDLRIGFTSEIPSTHTAPELTRVALEISRNVTFQTAGLPSCSLSRLYSSAASARRSCAASLIGHGVVDSEVTLPGQPTVPIEGHLLAFYAFAEGQPRILAQVTSAGALPLTYVIPFQIEKGHGPFGTSLVVRKMRQLQGECLRAHPNCFAQPYTLKGVYGHISKFALSLQRRFTHAGKAASFLSADCPAPEHQSLASPQFGVSLRYDLGSSLGGESATLLGRCKVAN